MNNIQTEHDVIEWAKEIVAANGEKYTSLAKGELFTIAKYIIQKSKIADDIAEDEFGHSDDLPPVDAVEGDSVPAVEPLSECETSDSAEVPATSMMRGVAMHRQGLSVQQAYDKFLEWAKANPKEATVMDFSTGVKSNNAAFAYWLLKYVAC